MSCVLCQLLQLLGSVQKELNSLMQGLLETLAMPLRAPPNPLNVGPHYFFLNMPIKPPLFFLPEADGAAPKPYVITYPPM